MQCVLKFFWKKSSLALHLVEMYKDPDPGRRIRKNYADPTGSGSTKLVLTTQDAANSFRKKLIQNIRIIFETEIASLFATITRKVLEYTHHVTLGSEPSHIAK